MVIVHSVKARAGFAIVEVTMAYHFRCGESLLQITQQFPEAFFLCFGSCVGGHAVHVASSHVADADATVIVLLDVSTLIEQWTSMLYRAVWQDDVVIANHRETALDVPLVDDFSIAGLAELRIRTMDDDILYVVFL